MRSVIILCFGLYGQILHFRFIGYHFYFLLLLKWKFASFDTLLNFGSPYSFLSTSLFQVPPRAIVIFPTSLSSLFNGTFPIFATLPLLYTLSLLSVNALWRDRSLHKAPVSFINIVTKSSPMYLMPFYLPLHSILSPQSLLTWNSDYLQYFQFSNKCSLLNSKDAQRNDCEILLSRSQV